MTNRSSPPVLPRAPAELVAVAVGGCQVLLAWTEVGIGAIGFRVERATGNSSCHTFAEIGGVGPHVTAFSDGYAEPRTAYSYRVLAWNPSGDSPPSNVVRVMTPQADTVLPAE